MIEIKEEMILEMSNVRGIYVENPHKLPFSFYFSSGKGSKHSIRVKPSFNPSKLKRSMVGTLELSGDWNYTPGENDKDVSSQKINEMKKFFRDNIVLFAMVWDEQIQDGIVEDYLTGKITFKEMLEDIDFYENYIDEMGKINTIKELDKFCRANKLVNFYGN